jgi:hypothetical protein
MAYLVDDIARALANPMPRRKSLRLLSGILGGCILGGLGIKPASAQDRDDERPRTRSGTVSCSTKKVCPSIKDKCCPGPSVTSLGTCCLKSQICCANKCVTPPQRCSSSS